MAKRRRPQIIFKLLVFLLLGAIINVAVAWGCAIWSGTESASVVAPPRSTLLWSCVSAGEVESLRGMMHKRGWTLRQQPYEMQRMYPNRLYAQRARTVGVDRIVVDEHREIDSVYSYDPFSSHTVLFTFSGWPARSGVNEEWSPLAGVERCPLLSAGIEIPFRQVLGSNLKCASAPLAPIWPGFAINTIFYAAIVWMLFTLPGYIKRIRGTRRIKRGLCARCAYPVGPPGSDTCTECGAPVSARWADGM